MKITRTTATLLGTSPGVAHRCRVEVTCDSGDVGIAIGDSSLLALAPALANEVLTGGDPRAVASHWHTLSVANDRAQGALGAAAAAIDCALWNLKTKFEKVPLWRSLGALEPRVNVHARIGREVADAAVAVEAKALAANGIRGVVLDSVCIAERDARRLAAARAALGPEAALMLDLDERLIAKDAIVLIANIEHTIDLTWVEAPASRADIAGSRRVSDSIRGAVCVGRHFNGVAEYLGFMRTRAFDIVQIDTARVGISGALQISDAAFGLELPVALTAAPNNLHVLLAAALPYCASVEIESSATASTGVKIENGWGVAE